jgi:hypothetical protein
VYLDYLEGTIAPVVAVAEADHFSHSKVKGGENDALSHLELLLGLIDLAFACLLQQRFLFSIATVLNDTQAELVDSPWLALLEQPLVEVEGVLLLRDELLEPILGCLRMPCLLYDHYSSE